MKKNYWLVLFVSCLIAELLLTYAGNETLRYITKPLLMPFLCAYYLAAVRSTAGFNRSIIAALFFSWLGDILLMFDSGSSLFFILGLSSFLIAHIFYIFFFHAVRIAEAIKPKGFLLIPVVVYYAVLISILSPGLGDMKLPVRVYGVVICFMLMLALHMFFIKNKKAGLLMAFGAFLFVISDSILAINKFYASFSQAGVLVMLTYGIAQLLIIEGAIKYNSGIAKTGNPS